MGDILSGFAIAQKYGQLLKRKYAVMHIYSAAAEKLS